MKILVIGRYYEEAFASFVADELERLGHGVVRFDPGPKLIAFGSRTRFYINRARQNVSQMLSQINRSLGRGGHARALVALAERAGGIDLVLSTHDYLSATEATALKRATKAPLVLWYPDPIWSFQRHMFLNAPYDLLFLKDPYVVDLIHRKLGKPARYMPECYSPTSLALGERMAIGAEADGPTGNPTYSADICTAGNLYAYRVALFQRLTKRHVKIWGLPAPLWMDLGGVERMVQNQFVAHADKVRAFRGAKIVLNTLNPSEIAGTNVRTFEICGAGGFQITDWKPGLGDLFQIGRELVTFDDFDDLDRKLDHYLAADDERRAIAAAGHARAKRDHTYAVRLTQLLNIVQGGSDSYPLPAANWRPALTGHDA